MIFEVSAEAFLGFQTLQMSNHQTLPKADFQILHMNLVNSGKVQIQDQYINPPDCLIWGGSQSSGYLHLLRSEDIRIYIYRIFIPFLKIDSTDRDWFLVDISTTRAPRETLSKGGSWYCRVHLSHPVTWRLDSLGRFFQRIKGEFTKGQFTTFSHVIGLLTLSLLFFCLLGEIGMSMIGGLLCYTLTEHAFRSGLKLK